MAPSTLDDDTLDILMSRVRAELLAHHGADPAATGAGPGMASAEVRSPPQRTASRGAEDASAVEYGEGDIPVEVFLAKHDEEFVGFLYRAVLRRPPDDEGLEHHLRLLRLGRVSRIGMLHAFVTASAAQGGSPRIPGLRRLVLWDRAKSLSGARAARGFLRGAKMVSELPAMAQLQQRSAEPPAEDEDARAELWRLADRIEQVAEEGAGHRHEVSAKLDARLSALEASRDQALATLHETTRSLQVQCEELRARVTAACESLARVEQGLPSLRDQQLGMAERLQEHDTLLGAIAAASAGQEVRLTKATAELIRQLDESVAERDSRTRADLVAAQAKLAQHWRMIVDQRLRLDMLLDEARRRLPAPLDAEQVTAIAEEQRHGLDALYVAFEDRWRGTREDIKGRQKAHVHRVLLAVEATGGAAAVDVGCGRGEWLEVLAEAGVSATGVDMNRVMIGECRERGLEAVLGEGIAVLRSMATASCAAVTAFHVIEHLPFAAVVELLDQALRILRPGGLVLLETPNPANLQVAAERFYLDPTHRNPMPADLVAFITEARGFGGVEIVPMHPMPWVAAEYDGDPMLALLQDKLFGPQDFAAVGWKR